MATSNKKTPSTATETAVPAKKAAAKKVVAATPKKAATAPAKKAAAVAPKKPAASAAKAKESAPAKKVSVPKTEKPASKAAAKKSVAPVGAPKSTVTPEERYHMIQTAAYYRAEQRGFAGGYEMEDWIAGEAQIDAKLNA